MTDKKTNGQKMEDRIFRIGNALDILNAQVKDRDLEGISLWVGEIEREVRELRKVLEFSQMCEDYGEEWDQ